MDKLQMGMGAAESPRDYRTITDDMLALAKPLTPNGKVELNKPTTDQITHQMKNGICTACSIRMAAEAHFNDGIRLSEWWQYLMQKVLVDQNLWEGSAIFSGLKSAQKHGIPTQAMEAKYPLFTTGNYTQFINDFKAKYGGEIPEEIMADAKKHKIPGYYSVALNPAALATQIQNGRLLMIRMECGDNFWTSANGTPSWAAKDLLPLRVPKTIVSGHAMAGNEHKGLDTSMVFSGPNSWSKDWARDGYYDFVFSTQYPKYFTEAWAIGEIPPEIGDVVGELPNADTFRYNFDTDIDKGEKGERVRALQSALMIEGVFDKQLYIDLAKSKELGFFGNVTAQAVIKYQIKKGIAPTFPRVGPRTRFELNKSYNK